MAKTKRDIFLRRLISHINRKRWWHVPPRDRSAYRKRGKFFASSFREAEFWGRPLDKPERVTIARPLIGDEGSIEIKLFARQMSRQSMTVQQRWVLDARMKRAAMAKGYDSIVLMTPKGMSDFRVRGKMPRSVELNVLEVSEAETYGNGIRTITRRQARRQAAGPV
jgi:hypothetical protein